MMDPEENRNQVEGKGAHINLALELDENIPGYEKFADVPIKANVTETKDVVDFPNPKSMRSETDVSNIVINEDVIFEELPLENDSSGVGNIMGKVQIIWETIESFVTKNRNQLWTGFYVLLLLLYIAYFCGAIYYYTADDSKSLCEQGSSVSECFWCHGLGFLIIITVVVIIFVVYSMLCKRMFNWFFTSTTMGEKAIQRVFRPTFLIWEDFMKMRFASVIINSVVIFAFLIFLIVDSSDDRRRLLSILGLVVITLFGAIFSKHPGRIRWRHLMWGLALQFIFGLIILRWQIGRNVFDCIAKKVTSFLDFTDSGSSFVYGYLVNAIPFNLDIYGNKTTGAAYNVMKEINDGINVNGETLRPLNTVFVFKILSVIFFFSFMVSMFYHLGVMQWAIGKIGWLLQISVGTTACESLNAAANIFLGQTEAPLMIKPYLPTMTPSELHAVMTGGFATIAGSVLAAYVSFGVDPSHLLSASVMSAPAALAYAKLFYPETKKSKTTSDKIDIGKSEYANLIDAASQGAITAVFLVANIAGSLIAVVAFIAFVNGILSWFGGLVGIAELSIELIFGYVFIPLAWLMGVDYEDCFEVGKLIGLKSLVNEFVAYAELSKIEKNISDRSKIIATYALCGFSNPASVGIQISAFSTLAPTRRQDFARIAFRSYIAGSMACFLTACVAGSLIA